GSEPERVEELRLPGARVEIEEERALGIGVVHGVHRSAAQPPHEKCAEGAPQRPPRGDAAPQPADVTQGPGELRGGVVRAQAETGTPPDRLVEIAAGARLPSQP